MGLQEALDVIYNKFGTDVITVEDWNSYEMTQKTSSLRRVQQGMTMRKQAGNLDQEQEELETQAVQVLKNSL